jgi:hypothetical protein
LRKPQAASIGAAAAIKKDWQAVRSWNRLTAL